MSSAILPAPDATTKRVSLRRRAPSGALSDVVGHLIAANQEWLVVLPEDRTAVWVPRAEAETIRSIPERVVLPASDAEGLERVFDRTWPGLKRARLGGWVLRSGRGASARANSVLAVGEPELPFEEAVAAPASYLRIGDVAVGRVAVSGRWAVLSCLEVRESERGLGHGRAMLQALGVEAVRLGARYLGLQVEAGNDVALGLYGSEGFVEHHRYSYLSRG